MAAIAQANLFSWDALKARSDLDRFFLVRDHLPDERLVHYLEVMRGNGRDDFAVRAMWNLLVAGVVFQHVSVESLLRELARNPSLLAAFGFDPLPVQRKPTRQWSPTPRRAYRASSHRQPRSRSTRCPRAGTSPAFWPTSSSWRRPSAWSAR